MRQVILGTDWWTDCDDAVAIRLLCNLHKKNELHLLGIAINACMQHSVHSLGAFVRDSGVSVPIGIDLKADDFGGNPPYQARLAKLPSEYEDNNSAEDAVALYRRLLASVEGKVEILEIGFPSVLSALLMSEPDSYSELCGLELVKAKVSHLWIMAGKWDEPNGGLEHNFCHTRRASDAAAYICDNWPTPMTFLGWEVGATVISGSKLPGTDILKQVLADHGSHNGRSSWDPMLILLAAAGTPQAAGYDCVYGDIKVNPENGANYFTASPQANRRFVVKTMPDQWYADKIDSQL